MPTFLVIGAMKSGTTACYFHLKAHPEIYMSPIKEPRFFAFEGRHPTYKGNVPEEWVRSAVLDLDAYQQLFDGATTERVLGEASPLYLSAPRAAGRIRSHLPDVKLIAILRDPAERAFSQFLHMVRDGIEPRRDFEAALDAEPDRAREGWGPIVQYSSRSLFYRDLSRYYALFDRSQIRVYLYEEYRRDPARVLRDMYAFLGVNPDFVPDLSRRYNESGIPRSHFLFSAYQRFANKARAAEGKNIIPAWTLKRGIVPIAANTFQRLMLVRPTLKATARARLRAAHREDTLALQDLIGRDLTHWL